MPPSKGNRHAATAAADAMQSQSEMDSQSEWEEEEQTEQEKREVRNEIRSIYQMLLDGKDRFTATDESDEFKNILAQAKNIVTKVKGTQEAIEDAKMFRLLCHTVKEMSEDTNTNEQKFHVEEYVSHLARANNFSTDSKENITATKLQWVSLGKGLSKYFSRAPTVNFVLGALDTEEGEMREKPVRQVRKVANRKEVATKIETIDKSEVNEQKTFNLVKSTKLCLEKIYKNNNKKPVDYFTFVIDPDSFGNTVENMFHVAFAVKDRSVRLDIDEGRGLPTLEPIKPGRVYAGNDDDASAKEQALISICMEDWRELKDALKITQPSIVHPDNLKPKVTGELFKSPNF